MWCRRVGNPACAGKLVPGPSRRLVHQPYLGVHILEEVVDGLIVVGEVFTIAIFSKSIADILR